MTLNDGAHTRELARYHIGAPLMVVLAYLPHLSYSPPWWQTLIAARTHLE
jgi:hypothetical protein